VLMITEGSHASEINRWKSFRNIFNGLETDGDIAVIERVPHSHPMESPGHLTWAFILPCLSPCNGAFFVLGSVVI